MGKIIKLKRFCKRLRKRDIACSEIGKQYFKGISSVWAVAVGSEWFYPEGPAQPFSAGTGAAPFSPAMAFTFAPRSSSSPFGTL